jgi:inhibitor of KinA sporulation pathway (predicted exonuclease)
MRDQNYLALDLEINTDGQGWIGDIIEVGISVGNPTVGILFDEKFLIKPYEKTNDGVLTPFIIKLTGITQEEFDLDAVTLAECADRLKQIITEYNTFVNPVQWGLGDADELLDAFKYKQVDFPHFGRRVIDVKHLFLYLEAANGRALSGGLRSAMGKYKIPFQGTAHRAARDAYNTLRFFFHLLERQKKLEDCAKMMKTILY